MGGLTDGPHLPCQGGISLPPAQAQFKAFGLFVLCPFGVELELWLLPESGRPGQKPVCKMLVIPSRYPSMIWWAGCSGTPSAVSPEGDFWSESDKRASGLGILEYGGFRQEPLSLFLKA